MKPPTKNQQACCYCGDSFASGEDVLRDTSPIFPEWEVIRHELLFPYHRVCWCWDRIDRWLCVNAPLVYQQLGKGATDDEINLTVSRFHALFPLDLHRSYRIHDGSGDGWLFDGGGMMSLHMMRHTADSAWNPTGEEMVWDHVPFIANCGGDYCCVDCNSVTGDGYGLVFWLSHETGAREVIASGFQHYLERFAEALERGCYREKQYNTFPALVPNEE